MSIEGQAHPPLCSTGYPAARFVRRGTLSLLRACQIDPKHFDRIHMNTNRAIDMTMQALRNELEDREERLDRLREDLEELRQYPMKGYQDTPQGRRAAADLRELREKQIASITRRVGELEAALDTLEALRDRQAVPSA
jgi:DNA repair exonuclease SbcCD ATPase subunit